MDSFINTFFLNWPFEKIHDLDLAQNENDFDTPAYKGMTPF